MVDLLRLYNAGPVRGGRAVHEERLRGLPSRCELRQRPLFGATGRSVARGDETTPKTSNTVMMAKMAAATSVTTECLSFMAPFTEC
jgi:hypothetical protein